MELRGDSTEIVGHIERGDLIAVNRCVRLADTAEMPSR